MMQTGRPLDPSLLKQTPPVKSYLDTYLAHNAPEMQKDTTALGSFNNFPLSMSTFRLNALFEWLIAQQVCAMNDREDG